MRHYLLPIAFLLTSYAATAQITVGPKVGLALGWVQGNDLIDEARIGLRRGIQAGGFVNVPLRASWSFQPELLYTQKGRRIRYTEDSFDFGPLPHAFQNRSHYLELPLLLRYAFPDEYEKLKPFLVVGPSVGYWLAASFKETFRRGSASGADNRFRSTTNKRVLDLTEPVDGADAVRLELSAVAGVGMNYESPWGTLVGEVRLIWGLTDPVSYEDEPQDYRPAPNRTLVLSVGYVLAI